MSGKRLRAEFIPAGIVRITVEDKSMQMRIGHLLEAMRRVGLATILASGVLVGETVDAADPLTATAVAPDNMVILRHGMEGDYFVDAGAKERYDKLVGQTRALEQDVRAARIT